MSERLYWFVVTLFVLSAALELAGVALLVQLSRRARISLTRFRELNPAGHSKGSLSQLGAVTGLVEQLLTDQVLGRWAVAAIVGGIVVGLFGNVLSLQ